MLREDSIFDFFDEIEEKETHDNPQHESKEDEETMAIHNLLIGESYCGYSSSHSLYLDDDE